MIFASLGMPFKLVIRISQGESHSPSTIHTGFFEIYKTALETENGIYTCQKCAYR